MYSLTTTTSQQKPKTASPAESGFPFPYEDDFEGYDMGKLPKYFMDQGGVFEVVKRPDGNGKSLRQMITQESPMSHWFSPSPETILGSLKWKNYEVSSDVHIEDAGFVCIFARMGEISEDTPANAYCLKVDQDGKWELTVSGNLLASGTVYEKSFGEYYTLIQREYRREYQNNVYKLTFGYGGSYISVLGSLGCCKSRRNIFF